MSQFYAHPTALVECDTIGENTRIWAFCHILEGAEIGMECNIGDHCFIEGGARIGNRVTIKNSNMLWDGITLEDGVFVGPHVFFTNDLYPRSPRLPEASYRYHERGWHSSTLVRHGASLGAAAVILAGVTIGEYSMVGAGAIVTRDVPAYSLVIGNPARHAGWVCQCGLRLSFVNAYAACECERRYSLSDDILTLIDDKG